VIKDKSKIVAIIWTLLIATSCLIPAGVFKPFSFDSFLQIDKVIHLVLFFAWTVFWLLALQGTKAISFKTKLVVLLLGVAYGALIEVLQSSMHLGRSFEVDDMVADSVGALIGVLSINFIIKHFSFFKKYIPLVKYFYPSH
jgi:hypothetical protein